MLRIVPSKPVLMARKNHSSPPDEMAWRRTDDKPSFEPVLARFTDAYMRHSASMCYFQTIWRKVCFYCTQFEVSVQCVLLWLCTTDGRHLQFIFFGNSTSIRFLRQLHFQTFTILAYGRMYKIIRQKKDHNRGLDPSAFCSLIILI